MFRSKPIISDDLGNWILDSFEWVMTRDGAAHWRENTQLVRPTKEFFDAPKGQDAETATLIGQNIMTILGMKRRDIKFEPLPALPDEIAHEYGKTADVTGQYWHDETESLITYDPRLMRRPISFINVLTHELMHAHLADVVNDIPGGEAAHELATDLHCITHGFGLFQLEDAEISGWSGYMTQPSRAFALAIFLNLTDTPASTAFPYLGPRSAKHLKRAIKDVEKFWTSDLDSLKTIG